MSKFGCIVMGPAGAGKTTFCAALIQRLRAARRSAIYVNLDPAADRFVVQPDVDIRDLVSLEEVMDEMGLGPNGGLVYCFEFLLENLDFLTAPLEDVSEEYLIIIDMPGQIELYTHVPVVPQLVGALGRGGVSMNLCAAYLLEATFVIDRAKFFAGALSAMSAMIMLELPHLNILSKMDLVRGTLPKRHVRRFLDPDAELLDDDPAERATFDTPGDPDAGPEEPSNLMGGASFKRLNRAVANLIDDYGMLSFLQLDAQDEDSTGDILSHIDDLIQFHEAQEPHEPNDELPEE